MKGFLRKFSNRIKSTTKFDQLFNRKRLFKAKQLILMMTI